MIQTQASSSSSNHYETLGVKRTATPKQIKAAFYELSKKYHPDMHLDDEAKTAAAEKFQKVALQVVNAYEVLGSAEKRKDYDMTLLPQRPDVFTANKHRVQNRYQYKFYEDFGIDYKTFERFQRSIRRRGIHQRYYRMPDEFFAEFGGREFSSFYPERRRTPNGAEARSEKEERLWREISENKMKSPFPSFEEMHQSFSEKKRREEFKNNLNACLVVIVMSIFAYVMGK
uniref:J domain-containing protein n=1 Tax=Syphacia muris TaxID=451379 RepID=A0A0N5ANN6_9BILA